MQLHFKQGHDLIFIDKPRGFSTHATDPGKPGIVEFYEESLAKKLYVVHRLDKSTSGAMLFATTQNRAQELSEQFKNRQISKKYLFLTDRVSKKEAFEVSSVIEQNGKLWASRASETPNAVTHFQRVKRSPFFELWQAIPLTGKTHQIRLHAKDIGLSILGDALYGGSSFPELCLHSQEISVPGEPSWQSPPPRFFERLGILKTPHLVSWLAQVDRRQRLFHFLGKPNQCLRLIHTPEFRLDLFGSQLWAYWYFDRPPQKEDLLAFQVLADILNRPWLLKFMQDRGQDPNLKTVWKSHDFQEHWQAQESQVKYNFREGSGQSAGLFLDQARHRENIQQISKDKDVLNLFSYTGGFSLVSALGGARQVTSVDASSNFINWGKENFILNSLDPTKYEFYVQDVIFFLKAAAKRGRKFDLIVCDPPSFGRFKNHVFRLEKDFEELVKLCWSCLNLSRAEEKQNGILFSCNLERWTAEDLMKKIKKLIPQAQVQINSGGLDYEAPGETSLMKSVWIQRA